MLYYYFESKEGLYAEVLKAAYAAIRRKEQAIDVDHLDPVAAIRRIAELTFDHHESHPDFIRLVAIENIHRAEHLAELPDLRRAGLAGDRADRRDPARGREAGSFTRDVDALDVHMVISSFCVFRIANRHTFGTLFGRDLVDADRRDALPPHARRPGRRLPHRLSLPVRFALARRGYILYSAVLTY